MGRAAVSEGRRGGGSRAGGGDLGRTAGRGQYVGVMDPDLAKRVKGRRLRTGQHVFQMSLRLDAKLMSRIEQVAKHTGFARGVVARAAIEQGLGAVEAALVGTQRGEER